MRTQRVVFALSLAIVVVAINIAVSAPRGGSIAVDIDSAAGGRRVCYDRFDDPRPECQACCGHWGQVARWGKCCTEGGTDCRRFCPYRETPPLTGSDAVCAKPSRTSTERFRPVASR